MAENCKNCNAEVTQNYCPNCGQPAKLKRIDGHYIIHEIEHVLHFERGILYTIRELITNPGQNVRNYIAENRSRLVKPIIFIIVTSLIYSVCSHYFRFEDAYVNALESKKSTTTSIFKWIQGHYGYSNILMGIFIAFWTKLFFRKYPFNFFEILILLCFAMGMGMLIFSVFVIFQGLTKIDVFFLSGIASTAYCIWAIGQFFDKKKASSYFKAFASYMIGVITFYMLAIALGTLIDILIKH
jgi:Protein of unknown function (DUF3667)